MIKRNTKIYIAVAVLAIVTGLLLFGNDAEATCPNYGWLNNGGDSNAMCRADWNHPSAPQPDFNANPGATGARWIWDFDPYTGVCRDPDCGYYVYSYPPEDDDEQQAGGQGQEHQIEQSIFASAPTPPKSASTSSGGGGGGAVALLALVVVGAVAMDSDPETLAQRLQFSPVGNTDNQMFRFSYTPPKRLNYSFSVSQGLGDMSDRLSVSWRISF